jgi:nucleotidyltransferase substrate binding protein (TIGR01987 family)
MMSMTEKPRWQYRFDNFKRAYILLREAMAQAAERALSQLEKEGIIQRFEYTIELAWKTMKDYLESQNLVLDQITPRAVIKEAFAAKLITEGQVWMDALDARNKMSHTYDFKKFEEVIADIQKHYLAAIEALYFKLLEQLVTEEDNLELRS